LSFELFRAPARGLALRALPGDRRAPPDDPPVARRVPFADRLGQPRPWDQGLISRRSQTRQATSHCSTSNGGRGRGGRRPAPGGDNRGGQGRDPRHLARRQRRWPGIERARGAGL